MSRVGGLVWILACVAWTHGTVESSGQHTRRRRQTENGGNNFTCPHFFNNTKTNTTDNGLQLPMFTSNCPPLDLDPVYHVAGIEEGVVVTWSDPVAMDSSGLKLRVVQVRGEVSGSRFRGNVGGRRHNVVYLATDDHGLITNCFFSFTVKVLTCPSLPWPSNGRVQCTSHNLPGSSCQVTCRDGYQLSGPSVVNCTNNSDPFWTPNPLVTCEKVSCGTLPTVQHGSVACTGSSYMSYCTVSCDAGYTLEGSLVYTCEADGWSATTTPTCTDRHPPSIHCPSPQALYADRGQTTVSATWSPPLTSDNVDTEPASVKVSGPSPGATIQAGTSANVTYKAVDTEGNESPECYIELRTYAISCGHPRDILNDGNLTFTCTLASFTWGDQCTLDCDWNLPLEGSRVLTCERNDTGARPTGYWSWGTGDQPYCRHEDCPDLDPPRHGYFNHSTVTGRPSVTMGCLDADGTDYDIPDMGTQFSGLMICHSGFGWSPYKRTPGCIVPKKIKGFKLDSEIFYYDGSCSQLDVAAITADLQEKLDNATQLFKDVCPANVTCAAVDLNVTCEPARNRRSLYSISSSIETGVAVSRVISHGKRNSRVWRQHHALAKRQTSSDVLVVTFDVDTFFDLGNMTSNQAYDYVDEIQLKTLKPFVQRMIDEGSFDLPLWTLKNDSFMTSDYGDRHCHDGHIYDVSLICKPCPLGYQPENGKCVECVIGRYNNVSGAEACTSCPDGTSTRHTGSEFITNCTRFCSPGTYSPDKFEPCTPCPRGSHQTETGQTSCTPCAASQTTVWTGSSSGNLCQDFDVLLGNITELQTVEDVTLVPGFTVSVWMKKAGFKTPHALLVLSNVTADILSINVTDVIRVRSAWYPDMDAGIGRVLSDAWVHVAVVIDRQSGTARIFFDGQLQSSAVNAQLEARSTDVNLQVLSDGNTGILLSGFTIQNSAAGEAEVNAAMATCSVPVGGTLMHMGSFRELDQPGLGTVVPSICNVVNHCRNSPCGSHTCVNRETDFKCICDNNRSGNTCDIPPDFCRSNACRNNGTCKTGEMNYTCECSQGYSGSLCETAQVDGGWSGWSLWSECTATCNNGSRQRSRTCTSPPPSHGGRQCVGDAQETERCNPTSCPQCPSSALDQARHITCASDESAGYQCVVQCQAEYLLPGFLDTYNFRCGLATGYTWLPMQNVPDCVEAFVPKSLQLIAKAEYNRSVSSSHEDQLKRKLVINLQQTPCFMDNQCRIEVTIPDVSTAAVRYQADLTHTGSLQYIEYRVNGTVSHSLQELIDATDVLRSFANIAVTPGNALFDAVVDGVTYKATNETLILPGTVSCNSGQSPVGCFCAECPAGTFHHAGMCRLCGRGSFQHLPGQGGCIACPPHLTTVTVGARSFSACSESVSTVISSSVTVTSPTPSTTTSNTSCPPGHFSDGDVCSPCGRGFYQPNTGQATCLECPKGYTTVERGASELSHCSVAISTDAYSSTTGATTESATTAGKNTVISTGEEPGGGSTDKTPIYIGAGLGTVSLTVAVVVVVVVCRRKSGKDGASGQNGPHPAMMMNLSTMADRLSRAGDQARVSNTYAELNDVSSSENSEVHYTEPSDVQRLPPDHDTDKADCRGCQFTPTGDAYYYTVNDTCDASPEDAPGGYSAINTGESKLRPLPGIPNNKSFRDSAETVKGSDSISSGSLVGHKAGGLRAEQDLSKGNEYYLMPAGMTTTNGQAETRQSNAYLTPTAANGQAQTRQSNAYLTPASTSKSAEARPSINSGYLTPADVSTQDTDRNALGSGDYMRMDSPRGAYGDAAGLPEQTYLTPAETIPATDLAEQEYIAPSPTHAMTSSSQANLLENDYLTNIKLHSDGNQ